ncbi:MAG: tetratricopeptide repeat protein [Anaerolineales bacterium]|nr:tetratricopeptide repeat protein [Anaerolineales bacterium]
MPPKLRLTLLGEVSIQKGKKAVDGLPSRAAEALFLYLACSRRPVAREKLAELLWADRSSAQGLTNLRTILTSLRRELDDHLVITREALAFNTKGDLWLDVDEFERQLGELGLPDHASLPRDEAAASKLRSALDLYRGDFLEGFHLRDGQGFEEWVILQRERLKRLAREGFRLLSRYHLENGFFSEGVESAARWLRLDPYDEEACRTQMWSFLRTGQRSAALQCYQSLKHRLSQDLGISPSPATTELFRRIQELDFPPAVKLPAFSSGFLGRATEIEELSRLLAASATRVVTVAGPGGIGKTRLAVEAARSLAERKPGQFLHGVHFVPLAALDTPSEIPARISEVIGLVFHGTDSLQKQLFDFLKEREVLLVLDNLEHLFDDAGGAIALLVELLRQAPGVRVLVTSRERLNLYDEVVFDVSGLEVPSGDSSAPQESSAVALFLQSAQRVKRDFSLAGRDQESVAHICRMVGGMPLAIELASAWTRQYSCGQIAAQIEKDLDFLASPYQDLAAGHRSLRAVFERSWSLLSPEEQAAFMRLSIFRGGFTLEAAQAVIGQGGAGLLISGLADQSLVQQQPDGRCDIHPMLLGYASEKLSASSADFETVAAAHTSYYLTFLTQLGDGESPDQRAAIRPERANIRASWERAIDAGLLQPLEHTAGILHSFFSVQSWFQEGIDLFQHALVRIAEQHGGNADGLLCDLLGRKARMHTQIGQLENARADLQRALTYLETMDDPARRSRVLDSLAITSYYAGDYPQAMELANESLQLSERENNLDGVAFSLNFLGSCAKAQGNFEQCRTYFERAVETYRAMQDEIGAAMVLNNLGNLLQAQADFAGAQEYYLQSSEIFKAQDHVHGAATTLANAGKLAGRQGDYELAGKLLQESLALKRQINDQRGEAVALAGLGDVSLFTGLLDDAKDHFLNAIKLAQKVGDVQLALDILAALTALTAKQGRTELARDLSSFVLKHDGTAEEARQRVAGLKDGLELGENGAGKWDQEMLEDVVNAVVAEYR